MATHLSSGTLLIVLCLLPHLARAQGTDTTVYALPDIEVEGIRGAETEARAPYAVSTLQRSTARIALEPGVSLDAVLNELPGVWINDRGNTAVGERISIRGMGWRAAFGVRGVQVLLDGIPLTMPDGQAVLDIIDPSFIRRAEVIRGPSSLFWGNGSGGALFIAMDPAGTAPTARVHGLGGSHGLRKLAAESSASIGLNRVHVYASDTRQDGYRTYGTGRFTRAGFSTRHPLGTRSSLHLTGAVADQDSENPGSLTLEQFQTDPTQASAGNVANRAAKFSTQGQLGARFLHTTGIGTFDLSVYGIRRVLDNPLAFAYINVDRWAGGLRGVLRGEADRLSWGFGLDTGSLQDDRLNRDNNEGVPGPDPSIDQTETVRSFAVYGFTTYRLLPGFAVNAGLRADRVRFTMDDHLLANGDQSGERTFSAVSPAIGASLDLPIGILYTNYRTAFETPTTTELVNRPDLDGGFNPDVEPQLVGGIEVGLRGALPERLSFDVAVFYLRVSDRIVPFQTAEGGDRTFYRNGGRNTHVGVEALLSTEFVPGWTASVTYTGSAFRYNDAPFDGNNLPGIPDHRLYASTELQRTGWWLRVGAEAVSSMYVDDENTEQADGYVVLDLYLGHQNLQVGAVRVQPFAKVANVFDTKYNGSIVVNASRGTFYEPAPDRAIQAGLNVTLP